MDIFNRQVSDVAGVFTADRAKLNWKNYGAALVQQMQFTYAQTITRLYEVGSADIYYVGGRTQGNAAVNRVVGPKSGICAFYTEFGDVCKSKGRNIQLSLTETDCSTNSSGQAQKFTLNNCVITQVSVGVTSQEMIISDSTNIMYSALECG